MSCIVLKQMVACPTCRLSKHTCVFSQVKNKLSDTSVVLCAVDRIVRVSTALIVYASCSCPAPHYRHCATQIELTYQHLKHARPSICTCMLIWSVVHISTWICIYSLHLSGHSLVIVNAWAVHINLMVNAGA
jgi:hypothetical protein